MDPADTEAFRQMIPRQGTLLGQHDQFLQEITSNLRELSISVHSQLPDTPEPPVPVPGASASSREPFIPAPERYEGDPVGPFFLHLHLHLGHLADAFIQSDLQ